MTTDPRQEFIASTETETLHALLLETIDPTRPMSAGFFGMALDSRFFGPKTTPMQLHDMIAAELRKRAAVAHKETL
jgi:hypothetical protein